jgi:hypothetical protein
MSGWTLPSPARRPIEWTQTVGGAAVEALAVTASQDRPVVVFADVEVDGAGRSRDERDRRGLVALADDPQGSVASFEPEVLDVGGAGFAHV